MPPLLRTGTSEDADLCARIWEASVTARDGAAPPDLAHVRGRVRAGRGRLRMVLGADGTSALAFALLLRAGDDALLSHLAVVPSAQRQGIAASLMSDAVAHARSIGASRLLLEVRVGNAAAIALYDGMGFRALRGPVPHPLGGEPLQLLGLELR